MENQVSLTVGNINLVINATDEIVSLIESSYALWLSDEIGNDGETVNIDCRELKTRADARNSSLSVSERGDLLEFNSGISAGEIDMTKGSARFELCQSGPEAIDGLQNALRLLLGRLLIERQGLILHAAAAETASGRSVVLAGRSGAGKTTLSRYFSNAGRAVYSDDLCCLKITGQGEVNLYSAPLGSEKIGWFSGPRRLSAIFLLDRAAVAEVSAPLDRVAAAAEIAAAVPFLAGYSSRTRLKILALAARVAAKVPLRRAMLRPEPAAVKLIEEYTH